jgi:hypothetical protein
LKWYRKLRDFLEVSSEYEGKSIPGQYLLLIELNQFAEEFWTISFAEL